MNNNFYNLYFSHFGGASRPTIPPLSITKLNDFFDSSNKTIQTIINRNTSLNAQKALTEWSVDVIKNNERLLLDKFNTIISFSYNAELYKYWNTLLKKHKLLKKQHSNHKNSYEDFLKQ